MFQCRLKIDGVHGKISLKEGLSIKDLSELLSKLSKCLSDDSNNFILTSIVESSYMPVIETDFLECVEKFNEIHQSLVNTNYKDLPLSYQDYAKSLKDILFERGLFIETSNSKDETTFKLANIPIEKEVYFSSITSLTGKVVALMGKNEKEPYFSFKTLRGEDYNISITPDQELKLKRFYKEVNIRVRVRIKVEAGNDKRLKTSLLDFEALEKIDFLEAVETAKEASEDIFIDINDSARLLKDLRAW